MCGEECSFASLPQLTLLLTFGSEPPALNWFPRLMCRCLPLDCGGLAPALLTDSGVSGTPDPVGLAPTELLAEATCTGPSLTTIDKRRKRDNFVSEPIKYLRILLRNERIGSSLSMNVISGNPVDPKGQGPFAWRIAINFRKSNLVVKISHTAKVSTLDDIYVAIKLRAFKLRFTVLLRFSWSSFRGVVSAFLWTTLR